MEQAARLDLTTYEDPVFYDRLERARVQATDRLVMIQQMGRLVQQVITTVDVFGGAGVGFAVAGAAAGVGCAAVVPGRDALCVSGICEELSPDAGEAADGLSATGRRKPRRCEGGQALRAARFFTDRFKTLAEQIYREDVALSRSKLFVGGLLGIVGTLGYYGAYVYVIWRTLGGRYDIGQFTF